MRVFGTPGKRLGPLFALVFLLSSMVSPAVLAQNEAGFEAALVVAAFNCDYDPGIVSAMAGTIPGDCIPTSSTWFSIQSDDGTIDTGCTTDGSGMCSLLVPDGAAITVTEDVSALAGIATPIQNPITAWGVTGIVEVSFININMPVAPPVEVPAEPQPEGPVESAPQEPVEVPPQNVPDTETDTIGTEPETPTEIVIEVPSETQTETTTDEPGDGAADEANASPSETPTTTATDEPAQTSSRALTKDSPATAASTPTSTITTTAQSTPTKTPTSTPTKTPTSTPTKTRTPTPTKAPTKTPAPVKTTYATVSNTGGLGLRCRTAPVSGAIIMVLQEGTRVETRGAAKDGWVPVRCGGLNGWMSTTYVTVSTTTTSKPTTPPATPAKGSATISGTGGLSLRCRTAPNTSSAIITLLPDGTRVDTRGAASNGWIPVRCGGQDGWISAGYASVSSTPTTPTKPKPTPTTPPTSGTKGYRTVTGTGGGGLNCRVTPVSGAVITIMREGSSVETRGNASNGWVPVRCSGQDGWASATYLSAASTTKPTTPTPAPAPPSGQTSAAWVSRTGGGGLNCRTAAVSGSVLTILPEGTRVDVYGSPSNGWAQIRCAGQTGWVSTAYLTFTSGGGSGAGVGQVWIDINLSTQYMTVYQGNKIIGQTYVSTGRYGFDTPPGTFYVNNKLTSQTMTGVLGGEYYYVENVPWVMYFTDRGHAIHGAYWHNNFGTRMSHGCVNLPVGFSQWLYNLTPIGTRVYIHY